MTEQAQYASKSTAKGFWQEHRIYRNRIELDTPFGTMTIPFHQIEGVEIARSLADGMRLHLRGFRPALKLDWADFHEHVVIDKNTGLFRHVAFTPENPEAFAKALDSARAEFRKAASK